MSNGSRAGALPRAIDMEISKRRKRLATITPKARALAVEMRELRGQIEQLEALQGQWANGMPAKTSKIDTPPQESPVTEQRCRDILDCLQEHGSLSPGDLAEELRWTRPVLNEPLRRLVDRGLVVGEGSTNDRTYRIASVTA